MKKKRRGVFVEMSDAELKAYREAKGDKSHREILLGGAGLPAVEKQRGRPFKSDATRDLEEFYRKFREDERNRVHAKLVKANLRGMSKDVKKRMLGDEWVWRDEVCKNCGFEYRTAFERESHCPRCGVVNKVVVPPHESSLGEPTFLNQPLTETEVEEGGSNLSTGYKPYRDPASNFELMKGGVADRSVIGRDESRWIGKQKKKRG